MDLVLLSMTLGFWFWPTTLAFLIISVLLNETDMRWTIAFPLLLWGLAASIIFDIPVIGLISANLPLIGFGMLCYIPIGILWSIFRWARYVKDRTLDFNIRYKKELDNPRGITKDYLLDRLSHDLGDKSRIKWDMAYWPLDMLGYFTGSFLRDLFGKIYQSIQGVYKVIEKKILERYLDNNV